MSASVLPYVYTALRRGTPVETGDLDRLGPVFEYVDGYHALFAARVVPERFDVVEGRKWGLTAQHLLLEVMDRQRRFIASLQRPDLLAPARDLRTVSLRYFHNAGSDSIDLILLGKAFASELGQAAEQALVWWQELTSLFSYDYVLVPLSTEEQFHDFSGLTLLGSITQPGQITEIRRYEMFIPKPPGRTTTEGEYILFPFSWHQNAMEQVWRAMAWRSASTLVDVTLRPTWLYEAEEVTLGRLWAVARDLANGAEPSARVYAQIAAQLYEEYIKRLRHPLLMRVHVVDQSAAMVVPQAVGTALSYASAWDTPSGRASDGVGYDLAVPTAPELQTVIGNLCYLETDLWGCDLAAPPYRRFRYLVDVEGAHCAFRLPFLPRGGLPLLRFTEPDRYSTLSP